MPKATEGQWWINGPDRTTTVVPRVKAATFKPSEIILYGEDGEIRAYIIPSPGMSVSIDPNS